jgi:CRISP-associated protein Cas1
MAGFDLRIGFLRGIRYGRESLALDLAEELRAPLVDRFTLALLNKRQLAPKDFEKLDGGPFG